MIAKNVPQYFAAPDSCLLRLCQRPPLTVLYWNRLDCIRQNLIVILLEMLAVSLSRAPAITYAYTITAKRILVTGRCKALNRRRKRAMPCDYSFHLLIFRSAPNVYLPV